MTHTQEVELLIEKAKRRVELTYGGVKRKWLVAKPENSYDSNMYSVKLLVLEGSPPKGYILADYCYGIVKGFGVRMEPIHTWRTPKNECI